MSEIKFDLTLKTLRKKIQFLTFFVKILIFENKKNTLISLKTVDYQFRFHRDRIHQNAFI